MNHINQSKRICLLIIALIGATSGVPSVYAESTRHASNQGSFLVNLFACTLNPGKTHADLWRSMERLADSTRDSNGNAFLWLPMRSGMDIDYIAGFTASDLTQWADNLEAFNAGRGAKLMPELAQLSICRSGIYAADTMRSGQIPTGDDRTMDAVVELYACRWKPRHSRATLNKAVAEWNRAVDQVDSDVMRHQYDAVLSQPLWGGFGGYDTLWAGNFPSLHGLAEASAAMANDPKARKALANLNATGECDSSLWAGYWLKGPHR